MIVALSCMLECVSRVIIKVLQSGWVFWGAGLSWAGYVWIACGLMMLELLEQVVLSHFHAHRAS